MKRKKNDGTIRQTHFVRYSGHGNFMALNLGVITVPKNSCKIDGCVLNTKLKIGKFFYRR